MASGPGSRWTKSFGDAPAAPLSQVAALLARQADKTPANVAVAACVGLMVQWTKARRDAFAMRGDVPQTVSRAEYDNFVALFGPEHTAITRASTLLQPVRPAGPALPTIVVAPYYHGAVQRGESEDLLKTTPPASRAFLVRLASEPGAFAFSSMDPATGPPWQRPSHHILIKLDATGQYYFPTLPHIRGPLSDVINGGCREGGISMAVQPSFLHTFTAHPDVQKWMSRLEEQVLSTPIDIAAPPPMLPPASSHSLGGVPTPTAFVTHVPPPGTGGVMGTVGGGVPVHRAQTAPEDGGAIGGGSGSGSGPFAVPFQGRYHLESLPHADSTGAGVATAPGRWGGIESPAAHVRLPVATSDGRAGVSGSGTATSWHTHAVTAPASLSEGANTVRRFRLA